MPPPRQIVAARQLARGFSAETLERRVLMASISGLHFHDLNGNGTQDPGEKGLAGWDVYLDLNSNGAFDGTTQSFASADVPKNLPDTTTVLSNLAVASGPVSISDIDLTLNITHTWDGDLVAYLISPLGTRIKLFDGLGNSGDNYTNTVFDDDAATSITSGSPPFSGSFRPEESFAPISGADANGTWQLEITDTAPGDVGVLQGWSLRFSTGEPIRSTDAAGAYSFANLATGTYTVAELPQSGWDQTAPPGGTHLVTLTEPTDAVNGIDFGARQPPGQISGTLFEDRNSDGVRQSNETPLAGWTVYLDTNNNGHADGSETTTVTDGAGFYQFADLPPAQYIVREVLEPGWTQTSPASGGAILTSGNPSTTSTQKNYTKSDIVVRVEGSAALSRLKKALNEPRATSIARLFDFRSTRKLLSDRGGSLIQLGLRRSVDPNAAMKAIRRLGNFIKWTSLDFVYRQADAREYSPNDPLIGGQYFHDTMHNRQAWDITTGSASVVVAITDDGLDLTHPDLAANVWTNPGEIPGNSIDDDNNGYVDDVHGWDFYSNDNDVTPDNGSFDHGTHVAGIVGARIDNSIGGSGTAGAATIMPIKFYGTFGFSSAMIAGAYAYAADNGAKILTTSYTIDQFVGDPVFTTAVQYVYDHNVLHFNSAGNSNLLNPGRQAFNQLILVAATNSLDQKWVGSNYGDGIDIAAPGESILSTVLNGQYAYKTGTSMASPNAAGAAALIWSAHPTWTRDQVAAQLMGTADNIDGSNPSYIGLLGSGRVNSYRAVSENLLAPRLGIGNGLPIEGGVIDTIPSSFTIKFNSIFAPATVNSAGSWELRGAGRDGQFNTADDVVPTLTRDVTYQIGTNKLTFTVAGNLAAGKYRFTAKLGLTNPFGLAIDGNGDGTGGDAFVRNFVIQSVADPYQITITPGRTVAAADFGNHWNQITGDDGKPDGDNNGSNGDPNNPGNGTIFDPGPVEPSIAARRAPARATSIARQLFSSSRIADLLLV